MTENLETTIQWIADCLANMSPEQVVISTATALSGVLAHIGIKLTTRQLAALGALTYSCLHLIGCVAERRELSAAGKSALAALEDASARFEDRVLYCAGLTAHFDCGKATNIYVGTGKDLVSLADVLPGGKYGREWKRVGKLAEKRREEVIERDRLLANQRVAARMTEARLRIQ